MYCLLLFFIASCQKEELIQCIVSEKHSLWKSEAFKEDYKIQFPDNYVGWGMVGFEGNFFSKMRADSAVSMNYSFCGPLFCNDFGATLEDPFPESIIVVDGNQDPLVLAIQQEFCSELNETISIFYFNEKDISLGKLYMKHDNAFREALTVYFEKNKLSEVKEIIKTIVEE
jgi:hypothetical protein